MAARRRSSWMNDELDALRDLADKFLAKELTPNIEKFAEQHHVDRDLWNKAGELGLLCLSIPEEYGGGGGDFRHESVLIAAQAQAFDTSWGVSLHNGIVAHYILAYGTEEQKQAWLPKMASGEAVGAIAMTEPGTGSDLQNVKTRAIKTGGEYVINGSKTFITNGQQADIVVLVCKTNPDEGAAGISLILVEADREGFRKGNILNKIGQKGQDTSELFFDDVHVPVENLLGTQEGQGFYQLMQQLPQERLIIGQACVAGMEVIFEETLRYTKEREAFGRPIFGFQNTKFKLAEALTETTIARVFVDDCIEKHVKGELDIPTVAMAKWWTSDRAQEVASECLQLFGGYGYMAEYPAARFWVDNRVQMIYAGTNEIMKEIIARTL
ncbi:acyl-CoA dehydrogenase family protein [Tsukamurella tyrosinosolvens]|uniref:Acyl-CoA dehydrogenase n=1 Tax=Tsukamurella tyrosinosolvens TaxID=57704 RepID=A0A1H4WYE0_TSUTY|nr:acyl-CoA dehydrogenase family protein [Tsukamurella tyrosinosolvens]AUN40980.1 acyl-CoA dehydrogenase [Tsukamurella tyrosinosolvens]KXO99738.1 acyl-CoA dehydrogenase [Tsukamurella tyrosinosolvens]KXP04314.1 acyl-CoA dehydrogenase [Tsukamurella tyrosinosolvens]KZL97553.1 acyl-CoA dehydrogenase [Tsukamurella tyrosinosolvens]MCA4995855.1 acyl-CoA dehydrogenase family protein [Tsukamurella tyrosinosolvens]